MIELLRIDSRLIHGQIIEGWLPRLEIARILVGDDEAARTPLIRAAMAMAVPPPLTTAIVSLSEIDFDAENRDPAPTLMLVREPDAALFAFSKGLRCPVLNIGNVHCAAEREKLTPSVFLSAAELERLEALEAGGQAVEVRALPHERPCPLRALLARRAAEAR